jgi:mitochondrial import inner membrane translocase subunit TIM23
MASPQIHDPQQNQSQNEDAASALRSATFSTSGSAAPPPDAVSASDVLAGAFDPTRLHPLARLGDQLDYLTLEDEKTNELPGANTALPSRGWGDDLCYGTGTTYLSGT